MNFSIWTWNRSDDSLTAKPISVDKAKTLISPEILKTMLEQGNSTIQLQLRPNVVTLKLQS